MGGPSARPASARQPGGAGPNRSALVSDMPGLVLSAGMCTVGLLPEEVTESLTQQLEEREGGGDYFVFYKFFLKQGLTPRPFFCGTLASNLYQESLCLHEMTI